MKPYMRFQIVGIITDTRNDGMLLKPQPQIIVPATQVAMEGFFYYVKTTRSGGGLATELREALWRVDPAIERVSFRPLDKYLERGLADRRALSVFGLIVLLIAAVIVGVGLFASLSASLTESAKELAIRAALGATPARLAVELLRWAFAAVILAGMATAVAVPVIARNIELDKTVLRPTPTSVLLCLLAMALVASTSTFLPVRRATCTRPADTLRTQQGI